MQGSREPGHEPLSQQRLRAGLGPSKTPRGILISIPPAATRQGNLIERASKSQSPVTCHFLDGFIIAFHVCSVRKKTKKPTGSSFGRLKGLRGFPADGNTVLCKCWQQREISFQRIIRSINERSCICWVVAMSKHELKQAVGNSPAGPKVVHAQISGAVGCKASPVPHTGVSQGICSQTGSQCCILKT